MMAAMHKQVKAFIKATNDEVSVDIKQKIVDNIYKNVADKPSQENLTVCPVDRSSSSKRKGQDKFTGIINQFIGLS